jgi:hypothetical protein
MNRVVSCVLVALMGVSAAGFGEQSTGAVVRGIQVVEDGGVTRVTIDADGPLPLPRSESLDNPPRIYFDLAGVNHKAGAAEARRGGVVTGVRIALRSANPQVTRVVLDLARRQDYRLETDERQKGRLHVLIGSASAIRPAPAPPGAAVRPPVAPTPAKSTSAPAAPAPSAAPPAVPAPAVNATPPPTDAPRPASPAPPPTTAKPPSRNPVLTPEAPRSALPAFEVAAYRKQVSGELSRMESLRVLIARIDAGENVGADTLVPAAQEYTELRSILQKVQPSALLAVTHDLLMTSCTLGAMATSLGIEAAQSGNAETRRRASSAAAGSMMLFDRACVDLICAKPQR